MENRYHHRSPHLGSEGVCPEPRDEVPIIEDTLDPADWDALRSLGHQMLDDMFDHFATLRERPVWQPMPEEAKQRLRAPLPREGSEPQAVYNEFKRSILAYPTGNSHPRFWGWVMGTGTPLGMSPEPGSQTPAWSTRCCSISCILNSPKRS